MIDCQDGQNSIEDEVKADRRVDGRVDDVKGEGDEATDGVDNVMKDDDKVKQHEENVEGNDKSKNFEKKTVIKVIQLVF